MALEGTYERAKDFFTFEQAFELPPEDETGPMRVYSLAESNPRKLS